MYERFNGVLLKQLRKNAGFSLRDLAGEFYRQFGFYTTYQTVDFWEQGRHQPKGHHLIMLAKIFDVDEVVFYETEASLDVPEA